MMEHQHTEAVSLPESLTEHAETEPWYEHDGTELFDDTLRDHLRRRFRQMNATDTEYSPVAHVGARTKIRSKDVEAFTHDLREAAQRWLGEYGPRLTAFGADNDEYDPLTNIGVVHVTREKPRKTVLAASYAVGNPVRVTSVKGKRQHILSVVRSFEQHSYHDHVVRPLFDEYNEKYPY